MSWMKNTILSLLLLLLGGSITTYAQTYSSTLLDAETEQPIPYAAVVYGQEQGVITNEEGKFSFTINHTIQPLDTIQISCMGYESKGLSLNQLKKQTIYLTPGGFSLVGVDLMGRGLTAEEIVERMVDSIPVRYNQMPVQKKFFLRQSTFDQLEEAKIVLVNSTIPYVNPASIDTLVNQLPKSSEYHTETLGTLYKVEEDIKIQVDKATEIYDKERQATFNNVSHQLEQMLSKHVKEDSYFKLKTGPVSAKLDLDTIIGRPSLAVDLNDSIRGSIKRNYLASRENRLKDIETQVFGENSRLEVIEKRKKYAFTKHETIEKDNQRYYVITFEPKKNAKLEGKMYINALDFALTRIEYTNLEPLKAVKFLGIKYNEPVYEGVAEYTKMKNGKYELNFSRLQHIIFIKAARPVKIAEKNKNVAGRRKQNEINIELYLTAKSTNVFEWAALETKGSSKSMFDMVPQRKILEVTYKTKYDKEYWKGLSIIAPSSTLEDFTTIK